ncbi:MAG: aspartate carbamoyltransferase catalytic subunit [Acidobacteria bacterium]|nr:aspartate carbamoyltransferase catalytic subunit [Acidobacteriota bacterium]
MRHLLSIRDLDPDGIERILATAATFQEDGPRGGRKYPTLRGTTIVNLFYEASTRTRMSFELAAKRLSADVVNFSVAGSSVEKGESLKDTARTIEAMGIDAIVVRHGASGAPHRLAGWVSARVINAGDGMHEHPTQALLDLYTIRQHVPSFAGMRVAIVGDVVHSRVARSDVWALQMMGADVTLVGPQTLMPPRVEAWGAEVSCDLDAVLPKADVVYVLRMQLERMRAGYVPSLREYARLWGLDSRRAAALKDDALIMHPGPMNRGVEIAADVAEASRALITDQVSNGVAVRMALLYLMLGGPADG